MHCRAAVSEDLLQLYAMFRKIIAKMNRENGQIWDEIYPCSRFAEDIQKHRLFVLEENGLLLSAFALWDSDAAAAHIKWEDAQAKAMYFGRFGVDVDYQRNGIGSIMLNKAMDIAKKAGAAYLRLFVVDKNKPAIEFYTKNGFQKAAGVYTEVFDDGSALHEFGFEIKI